MKPDPLSDELACITLRPQDASPQAADVLRSDEAVRARWESEAAFDKAVAKAYLAEPLPADLEEDLLRRLAPAMRPQRAVRWRQAAWAAAAVAACVCVFGWLGVVKGTREMPAWQTQALALFDDFDHARRELGFSADDLPSLRSHLGLQNSTLASARLPAVLDKLRTYGCTEVMIGGHKACIICFELPSGKEAHIAVVASALADSVEPKFGVHEDWSHASWSQHGLTYMLGTTAGMDELRRFLDLV